MLQPGFNDGVTVTVCSENFTIFDISPLAIIVKTLELVGIGYRTTIPASLGLYFNNVNQRIECILIPLVCIFEVTNPTCISKPTFLCIEGSIPRCYWWSWYSCSYLTCGNLTRTDKRFIIFELAWIANFVNCASPSHWAIDAGKSITYFKGWS